MKSDIDQQNGNMEKSHFHFIFNLLQSYTEL